MRNWVSEDYDEWLDRLESAESLLPQDSEYRLDVARIREQIEAMRRLYRDGQVPPKFDLFLEMVAKPLVETAEELQNEIERQLSEKEFVLVDEGDIPERYRQRVADYFKGLAEGGGGQ
jgi:hypothetical protein